LEGEGKGELRRRRAGFRWNQNPSPSFYLVFFFIFFFSVEAEQIKRPELLIFTYRHTGGIHRPMAIQRRGSPSKFYLLSPQKKRFIIALFCLLISGLFIYFFETDFWSSTILLQIYKLRAQQN
jgi:hypothetical protein